MILFPAILIWYINFGGVYAAISKRGRIKIPVIVIRVIRITLAIIVPVAVYVFLIWFFYGHFGWPVAVAMAVVFPVVLIVPALIWAAVVSGLYQVALYRLQRRVPAGRRKVGKLVEEPVVREDS
ncbi:MAG: hypothetical protein A2144_01970 [Chloroflexi bacterium RBG_16_50_9]|nr:MAG: hypothetical protein A2144_01970 [Chloroflexi bacterium RBG_16_50_9]